ATNVAETSLTVPNIGYVIDPGMVRINRYSYRSKLQRLPIEPISQASADQRKGRCGRVAPGTCYRLYDEQDFMSRPDFTDPEILRVNLASVVLQMLAFKLGKIQSFPFLDPPDPRAVRDAHTLLLELRALQHDKLTRTGQHMARMPVDPRLARMLVEAQETGALREMLIITAALAIQDPRERPVQKAQAADEMHAQFADEKSDFFSYLNLWQWLEEQRQALTRNQFNRALKKRFLHAQRVQEWREVHRQLRVVCRELGYRESDQRASYEAVHTCVIAGGLSLVAQHDERGRYHGARNLKLRIFPGSGLNGKTPRWLVAAEIAETSRVYARNVAAIEPGWVERVAPHLLKHHYSEPFWSVSRGEVMAHKNSSLYGLRLVERRQISFRKIDEVVCRDLFLREGLVAGQVKQPPDFLTANLLEIARVQELEAKGRRRDLLVSDDEIYDFYARRIPQHISRMSDLLRWLKRNPAADNTLRLSPNDLFRTRTGLVSEDDFPGVIETQGVRLKVNYRFAPGEQDDGLTVTIPVGLLNGVHPAWLEWSVPGFLNPLLEQWLRALPKAQRRQLVPLPEKVAELTERMLAPGTYRQGRLLTALANLLRDTYRVQVTEADWDRQRVAEHLLPYIKVVDKSGKVVGQGRDLGLLKEKLNDTSSQDRQVDLAAYDIRNLQEYPEQAVPPQVIVGGADNPVIRYPGLQDVAGQVNLVAFADARTRDQQAPAAYGRLALQQLGRVTGYFRKELDKHPQLGLHYATLGNADELKDELLRSVVWYCFFEDQPLPSGREAFAQRLQECRPALAGMFNSVTAEFAEVLALRFTCVRSLDQLTSKAYGSSCTDIRAHLDHLVPKNVLATTPSRYLVLLPRYLRGIERRIAGLNGHVPKDRKLMAELEPLLLRLQAIHDADLFEHATYMSLRFYVEELRLNLFAEGLARQRVKSHPLDKELGAGWKASVKRVGQALLLEEQRLGLA
ncbi:MAG: ATP-dependent RNA helicase HrpA, partial [Pseudomonadota bacterium]